MPWWKFLPKSFSSVFTDLVRHKDTLFRLIGTMVDDTLTSEDMIKSEDGDEGSKSILEQLLANDAILRNDVKSSVIDYITAGVDTIGNSMLFAIALIGMPQPTVVILVILAVFTQFSGQFCFSVF